MVLIGVHELVDINYRFMILYSQCDIHREAVCLRAGMQCRRAWGPGSAPKLSRLDFRTAAGEEGSGTGGHLLARKPSGGPEPVAKLGGWRLRDESFPPSILVHTSSCSSVALK